MPDQVEALEELRTSLIDSRNGYEEALEDAQGKGLTPLFGEMIELRANAISELGAAVVKLGGDASSEGSFMSAVHRTVISIRSMLTGLDDTVLPALVDGEHRILEKYDDTLKEDLLPDIRATVAAQRAQLARKIEQMKAQTASSDHPA
jgi:uncharacterized protein (TIGR02284 family)